MVGQIALVNFDGARFNLSACPADTPSPFVWAAWDFGGSDAVRHCVVALLFLRKPNLSTSDLTPEQVAERKRRRERLDALQQPGIANTPGWNPNIAGDRSAAEVPQITKEEAIARSNAQPMKSNQLPEGDKRE